MLGFPGVYATEFDDLRAVVRISVAAVAALAWPHGSRFKPMRGLCIGRPMGVAAQF